MFRKNKLSSTDENFSATSKRILVFIATFIFSLFFITCIIGWHFFQQAYIKQIDAQMLDLIRVLEQEIHVIGHDNLKPTWCTEKAKKADFRLTIINATTGIVFCDSVYAYPTPLSSRPEIQTATRQSSHSVIRFSNVLKQQTLYRTIKIPLKNGEDLILRTGIALSNLQSVFDHLKLLYGITFFILLLGTLTIFYFIFKKIITPAATQFAIKKNEDLKKDFVANVTHELKTPLTSIQGFVETAILDLKENKSISIEYLEIIHNSALQMSRLVNDLLDIALLESHTVSIQKQTLSTEEISKSVIEQVQLAYKNKNQTIDLKIQSKAVSADPFRLQQILYNLIENACKYTQANGKIEIAWKETKTETTLEVKDNGPGIPKENHKKIFERFYRVTTKEKQQGFGLGLAIVKQIIDLHKGTIQVQNTEDEKGTHFTCSFPR